MGFLRGLGLNPATKTKPHATNQGMKTPERTNHVPHSLFTPSLSVKSKTNPGSLS